ncbi:MAG: MATE family efflux transporter [Leptolyngbyaceae cyanobacterium T60_A2020_046]|nr:MATE family efflux transporter [Leptolyngbyaceae cyanobacterium T60_A2020_046]
MTSAVLPTRLRDEARAFLQLAIPLASAQVAQAMTGFVDTVMMGWLGQTALASGGLAAMVFLSFLVVSTGVVSSVSPLVAEAYGAQQPLRVGLVARQGSWLAVLLTVPQFPIMGHLDGVMVRLGQDPAVVAQMTTYLDIIRWGLLPALLFAVLRGVVSSLSQARAIMVIVVVANLLNVVWNYIFAFGKLGLPAMGLAGLALASAIAHWLMFLALLGYILWRRVDKFSAYRFFDQLHRVDLRMLRRLTGLGWPIGVATLLEQGLFLVMTLFMGALGTSFLAAHQLALQTVTVIFMVPLAMSNTATIRVGQWFGRRDWAGIRRAAIASTGCTAAFMALTMVLLLVFPRVIIGFYIDVNDPSNADLIQAGVALLMVAGYGQVLDGVQRTLNGVLHGLQDTRAPMVIGTLGYWGVGMTTSYWLGFHTPLAGVGVWLGSYVGLAVAAIALLWRFSTLMPRKECRGERGTG